MTTVEEDRTQARIDGLLEVSRETEVNLRRSYSQMLDVVAELEEQKAGAVAGFGTTARLLAGVLHLSKNEAKARAEQAGLLTPPDPAIDAPRHPRAGNVPTWCSP